MKKVIQTRTGLVHWHNLVVRDAVFKRDILMMSGGMKHNQDEINRLEKIIYDNQDNVARYSLAAKIHGEPVLVLI